MQNGVRNANAVEASGTAPRVSLEPVPGFAFAQRSAMA
jgi:hypothetical protein